MNIKINTICFIILLFLLIGAVQATDHDNETLQQTIEQPDGDVCPISVDNDDTLKASSANSDELESSAVTPENLKAKVLESLTPVKSSKTKTSIKTSNVEMYYKGSSTLSITLKDSSKNVIKKAKIKLTVFGKSYTATTDSKGKASFTITGTECGTFKAQIKYDGSKTYYGCSAESTITVKSTIKSSGMTKYYTNKAAHTATFYDKKGKVLKNTAVKFKLNGKTYSIKTDKKGVAKLSIDLKPGNYVVSQTNPKTAQTTTNIIQIKTILETMDLTMTEKDGSKFTVKVLNSAGKVASGKKVTLKVDGKTYTPKSNSKGIATQTIDLKAGKYTITTEYEGLIHTNHITVNKGLIHASFSHITMIPDYVNVTVPYAFHNSAYTLKTGEDGIIKLPKNDVFAIHISEREHYEFSTFVHSDINTNVLDHKTYLIPFDGSGLKSDYNKDNLKGDGILISNIDNFTQIEFRSTTEIDSDLFGVTIDNHIDNIEIMTYIQNDLIKARILFFTNNFDEIGLKSNLGKLYGKSTYEINYNTYDQLTMNNADKIIFTNTGETVKYSDSGKYIQPVISKDEIVTKFIVNGVEELERSEIMSYGLNEKYQVMRGFEVLQSYAIINDKITRDTIEKWLKVNSGYIGKIGLMNIYGMFLTGLETAWLADEIADSYAKELNVSWNREKTTTILGGINLDDTYLHILNADMGMEVVENTDNASMFRLLNSLNLPNIEEYVLEPVASKYQDNATNSLDNVLSSATGNFSIAQLGELLYVFNDNNSAIILNTTSGVTNVISKYGNAIYKGSKVQTSCDCCSAQATASEIMNSLSNLLKNTSPGLYLLSDYFKKAHPLSTMAYNLAKFALSSKLTGVPSLANVLLSTMVFIQATGSTFRDKMVDEKDWHSLMDKVTFTRPGYLQSKKIYNIPNKNGGTDYIEVKINDDLSLNRSNVKYICDGKTRQLSEQETYQYFSEETWTPFSMPTKYWDKSWKSK